MMQIDIARLVPRFLLEDANGYALSKAIEAGLKAAAEVVWQGLDCLYDYDTMPEWRLDELAWELNCLYDFSSDIEYKRRWIVNAIPYYRLYGTPQALVNYVGNRFDGVALEEAAAYGGDPFHFRLTLDGEWTRENIAWAKKAVEDAKNVRSVLDSMRAGSTSHLALAASCGVVGRYSLPVTGAENWAGRWPQEVKTAQDMET